LRRKPEGKRPLVRWVENIKITLREIACDGMDWTILAQEKNKWAHVKTVMTLKVP
jgi:hypothetical protein